MSKPLAPVRVLVVDDDKAICEYMETFLAKDGVEVPPERTRAEFARYVADEHAFWGRKLRALKIDME